MIRALACLFAISASITSAACGAAPKPLPSDLPPPEYEKPRGYDLGASSAPAPTVTPAAPSAAPPASSAPRP